jgi:hypothetical protein
MPLSLLLSQRKLILSRLILAVLLFRACPAVAVLRGCACAAVGVTKARSSKKSSNALRCLLSKQTAV